MSPLPALILALAVPPTPEVVSSATKSDKAKKSAKPPPDTSKPGAAPSPGRGEPEATAPETPAVAPVAPAAAPATPVPVVKLKPANPERPLLSVFDLRGIGTRPQEPEAIGAVVVRSLRELEAFEVLSSDDLRAMLSIERQKQLLGDESEGSTAGVARAVGARHHVVGSVTRTESGLSLELRLLDTASGKIVEQRSTKSAATLEALSSQAAVVAQELMGKLLAQEQGSLLVRTREEGVEVFVDEQSRGSTPLAQPLNVARGKHRVTLKKDGFINRTLVTHVTQGELAVEDVTLVPSPDFAKSHAARNSRLRVVGVAASAVAILGIAAAVVVDRAVAEPMYNRDFKPRQQVLEQLLVGGVNRAALSGVQQDCAADPMRCREDARAVTARLNTLQIVSWALVGVAAVAAVAAAYCFIFGEDPNRYAQLVASVLGGPGGFAALGR